MFNKSSPMFRGAFTTVLVALIIFSAAYFASVEFAQTKLSLFKWYERPYVTNAEGVQTTQFRAGDAFVVNYFVEREPLKCWAVFTNVLTGPVSYQLPATRSQVITKTRIRVPLKMYEELPAQLPAGQYRLSQIVYPTCGNVHMLPFKLETGIVLDVLKKDAPKPVVVTIQRERDLYEPDFVVAPDQSGDITVPPSL